MIFCIIEMSGNAGKHFRFFAIGDHLWQGCICYPEEEQSFTSNLARLKTVLDGTKRLI